MPVPPLFDDPLELAAPLAHRLAREHCGTDPVHGGSCAWYHGTLLFIRALRLGHAGIPASHRAFFTAAFGDCAAAGHGSILLAGSGDYRMPALILACWRAAGAVPDLTVLDLCATPLRLTEWYGRRQGAAIATSRGDVMALAPKTPFDVVATHHLMNYFPPAARPPLAAKWHALLRPGGRLVVVSSFGTSNRAAARDAASDFAAATAAAMAAARERRPSFAPPADELAEIVRVYRERIGAYCLDDAGELIRLLEAAGFVIEHSAVLARSPGADEGPGGRAAVGVVARRNG